MRGEEGVLFKQQSHAIGEYLRERLRDLRRCSGQQELDRVWGDILVHRQALQDSCTALVLAQAQTANAVAADKVVWKVAYYECMVECRKRLRLDTAQHSGSHTSSLADSGSMRSSEQAAAAAASSSSGGGSGGGGGAAGLEEWQRCWWSVRLAALLNEGLGYFQGVYDAATAQLAGREDSPPRAVLAYGVGYEQRAVLEYGVEYVQRADAPAPAQLQIARRVLLYVGDVYRYQSMYLPQLARAGGAGLSGADAAGLLALAQWAYGRAAALHFDSGRACMQLALAAAVARRRPEAAQWLARGLCYGDAALLRGTAAARAAAITGGGGETEAETGTETEAEALVADVALAVAAGCSADAACARLLAVLGGSGGSGAGAGAGMGWARELRLGVALAAAAGAAEGVWQRHGECVQGVAAAAVLRQARGLRRALAAGDGAAAGAAAGAVGVWVDVWRGSPRAGKWLRTQAAGAAAALREELAALVAAHGADPAAAHTALAHDVALLGWRHLRAAQQRVRYDAPPAQTHADVVRVVLARVVLLLRDVATGSLTVVPDCGFWLRHPARVLRWARGGACAVVLADAVAQQLAQRGGAAAAALRLFAPSAGLARWADADALMADDDDDNDSGSGAGRPTAADVPADARAALSCALRLMSSGAAVAVATDSDEAAYYASWFAVAAVGGDGDPEGARLDLESVDLETAP
ncbi:hypothetical protein H4R26_004786 [Coemansia thaxteri]|uniref:Uncharacterized protein n=1 Tax=Coemansia thaxteri TaxID=2663907 RepID=A0A9W8BGF0_9FUNG|nr:hypothetical protein H4R26_004786 [Coemansia thaxteri]